LGSDFSNLNDLMIKLSKINLKEKSEQEAEKLIIETVNEISKNNNNFQLVMDDGLVNSAGQMKDRNKSEAALMANLITRCVSNNKNTKHLPFQKKILGEFGTKGYPTTSLYNSYDSSLNYLSEMNLIQSIDDGMESDLHKRILSQTWKQWFQKEGIQNKLESTRKLISIKVKESGKKIEKTIIPDSYEIDEICSQFYSSKNLSK